MENRQTAPGAPPGWLRRHATKLLVLLVGVLIVPATVQAATNLVQISDDGGKNVADVDSGGALHVRAAPDLAPFQKTIPFNVLAGDGDTASEQVTQVPVGKRLVLDYVSGWSSMAGCSGAGDYLAWISARLDPTRGSYQRFFVPTFRTQLGTGAYQWHFGTPVHGVAGSGTTVFATLQRYAGCGGVLGAMTIAGHFVADQD
jgi:hypothetical protein